MDATTLEDLLNEAHVVCLKGGLNVTIRRSWIIAGEHRLSYTTLIRLIECCRELHWRDDIMSISKGHPIDSITKSITALFKKAIPVGSDIFIGYDVIDVREKGYSLKFEIRDKAGTNYFAECEIVSIFYDPRLGKACFPPQNVTAKLNSMHNEFMQTKKLVINSE